MTDRKLVIFNIFLTVLCVVILVKFAQVGLEVQGQAEEASRNPLGALFSFLKKKPAA